jgi:hypothetical protein
MRYFLLTHEEIAARRKAMITNIEIDCVVSLCNWWWLTSEER